MKLDHFKIYDNKGKVIAIYKTQRGLNNWKRKHNLRECGFHYTMNGKPIYIDACYK